MRILLIILNQNIELHQEKNQKSCLNIYPETEVISLIQDIFKTKNMKLVRYNYK